MNILVTCEFSGIVRTAFHSMGHTALSCDLLPSELPGLHYQGNIFDILYEKWDMMIAFPPCTHLAISGARWFSDKQKDGRQFKAIDFFLQLATCSHIPKICIENPIGIMSTHFRKPDQIIQPYEHGHPQNKKTCLWLKGIENLKPSNIVPTGDKVYFSNGKSMQKWYADSWNLSDEERRKLRSRTYCGIARAMAEQWGH